jgi:hypothetical protein
MARQTFRFNLSSSEFPFLSSFYGRSIVYPQQDMHYVRPNAFTGSEADHNIGIPQMIFCENVLPMATGYQSINYSFVYQSNQGANVVDFDNAFYLRDASENRTLFVPGIVGTAMKRYTYDPAANTWNSSAVVLSTGDVSVSVANLKGRTFIHAEFNANFYEWTGVWNVVAIPALVGTNIRGLTSANAYLIAWDYDTIYWSSTTNPVDFVPSLATGAGSEKLLSRKGRIVSCKSIEDGFIIYCEVNTLIAKYSGNIRFPWNIKEIKNSGGISSPTVAANGGDGLNIYVYSTNGLMANGPNTATLNFATVNEFLGFRRIESWNPVTKNIDVVDLTDTPRVKLDFIANRWLDTPQTDRCWGSAGRSRRKRRGRRGGCRRRRRRHHQRIDGDNLCGVQVTGDLDSAAGFDGEGVAAGGGEVESGGCAVADGGGQSDGGGAGFVGEDGGGCAAGRCESDGQRAVDGNDFASAASHEPLPLLSRRCPSPTVGTAYVYTIP